MYNLEKIVAFILLIFLLPIYVVIGLIITLTSNGPILHCSKRIGAGNKIFIMYKFRTMQIDTPQLATHLMDQEKAQRYVTNVGKFLRKYSLDELPQLWNIVKGEMSFVGPRPALFNQYDLIELRQRKNIHLLKPGLTGLAQINGRDELTIDQKVAWDKKYLENKGLFFDLKIIGKTIIYGFSGGGVKH